ncbi:MAG TPA: hypothetical protein PLK77_06330 [Pyrinomonadaceae bacterium]|nr:hypothetical protein [Pyrinomonadaceae bacterium]
MSVNRLVENKSAIGNTADYAPLVTIYSDASCMRNGAIDSSAGCGAVMLDQNRLEIKLLAKYLGQTTNQQAEIMACTHALEQLRRCCRVEIVSDSKYVIDTMIGRNHMRANRSFWTRLVKACYGHHVSWRWVKGHSGVPFQEVADRLARAAARVYSDLSADDLEQLSSHLSGGFEQFDIRNFEIGLEKIVSRYGIAHQSFVPAAKFDGIGTLPSAFSA